MGWQSDVAVGFAVQLAAAGVGVWDKHGSTGTIYRGPLPPDLLGVGVQTYRVGPDDPQNATTQLRIQFWLRAATVADLDDLDSVLYDAVQGLAGVAMGVATVTDCRSLSSIPMGVDGNGNVERACNFTVDLDLPPTALRP
jgi:hypothetical protein